MPHKLGKLIEGREMIKTPVIDFHTHAGGWASIGMKFDVPKFIEVMDSSGVDISCINCIFHGKARRSNDIVSAIVKENPDRFAGVGFVTPHYPDECINELERCFDQLGMKFLKIYPDYFGKPVDDPGYYPIFEWADQRNLVIMCHSSYGTGSVSDSLTSPLRFIGLSDRYPNIRWVLAHSGNDTPGQIQAVTAGQSSPNIFLETCTSFGAQGTIEFLVQGVGGDRVLFGSDMPLLDGKFGVGRIVTANISEDDKKKILGLNAMKLLNIQMNELPNI